MAIHILASGDLHLGKRSSGLPEATEESATRYTWKRMVDLAIRKNIDVMLLLGDIVDQDNRYFEAVGQLQMGFDKLEQHGIKVYMVSGNHDHDVLVQIAGSRNYSGVHLIGANGKWEAINFTKGNESLRIVGWSFPQRSVEENPLEAFPSEFYDNELPVIGLLHADVDMIASRYAPVSLNDLAQRQVDAWLLGHIHKPQQLRKTGPEIWYTGSPHALSAKEPGIHGPLYMAVEGKRIIKSETIPLSPVRYESIRVDVTTTADNAAVDPEAALRGLVTNALFGDAAARETALDQVSFLVYDIQLEGTHSRVRDLDIWTRSLISDFGFDTAQGTKVSVRKVTNLVRHRVDDLQKLANEASPAGIIAQTILALQSGSSTHFLDELLKKWALYYEEARSAAIYHPLRIEEGIDEGASADARSFVLHECNRLLNELMSQRTQ